MMGILVVYSVIIIDASVCLVEGRRKRNCAVYLVVAHWASSMVLRSDLVYLLWETKLLSSLRRAINSLDMLD